MFERESKVVFCPVKYLKSVPVMHSHHVLVQSAYDNAEKSMERLELTKKHLIPSLVAQTVQPKVAVSVWPYDPFIDERIKAWEESGIDVRFVERYESSMPVSYFNLEDGEDWGLPVGPRVAATRIDDDDIIPIDYIQVTQQRINRLAINRVLITWPKGYSWWEGRLWRANTKTVPNMFCTVVSCSGYHPHMIREFLLKRHFPVVFASQARGWCWYRHSGSVVGEGRVYGTKIASPPSPNRWAVRLPVSQKRLPRHLMAKRFNRKKKKSLVSLGLKMDKDGRFQVPLLNQRIAIESAEKLISQHTNVVCNDKLVQDPAVSVCLITFNHKKYIREAIESVVSQETEVPFEIVIGDDCSTDGTQDIVLELQRKYSGKIRVLTASQNLGKHTRNGRLNFIRTFRACRGKYIALLDGDDYWSSICKIQRQFDAMESHESWVACFHQTRMVHENAKMNSIDIPGSKGKREYSLADIMSGNVIATASMMIRNGIVCEFPQWYYDIAIGDWPLYVLHARHGKIGFLNEMMAVHRVNERSIFSSLSYDVQDGIIQEVLETMKLSIGQVRDEDGEIIVSN